MMLIGFLSSFRFRKHRPVAVMRQPLPAGFVLRRPAMQPTGFVATCIAP